MRLIIETTQHDIDTANPMHADDCVVQRALKRALPDVQIECGVMSCRIDDMYYTFPEVIGAYINNLIDRIEERKPARWEVEYIPGEPYLTLVSGDTNA